MSYDYRNMACEHLAECEIELRAQLLFMTSERDIYRDMTVITLAQLHAAESRNQRLREAHRRLADEYCDHRVRCLAAANARPDESDDDQ